jgi:hypothetical protein
MGTSSFSDELRQAVAESGMTAYELSIRAGVASASLNRFISGRSGLYSPTIDRLAEGSTSPSARALGRLRRPPRTGAASAPSGHEANKRSKAASSVSTMRPCFVDSDSRPDFHSPRAPRAPRDQEPDR